MQRMRLFVFGLGYSAGAFAQAVAGETEWIAGTWRSGEKPREPLPASLGLYRFDGTGRSPEIAAALDGTTHLLVSVPPGESGDPVLACHEDDIAAAPALEAIVYLSTVGVYGDHGGAWVDEETVPRPVNPRSVARLEAETAWRSLAGRAGVPLAILRLAGIYGPGRNPFAKLAAGTAHRVVKPGQVFNRIHVDDVAAAIAASFAEGADGIFNVADDEPAPPQDVVAYAAALAGIAPPPEISFESADLTPMARSFYGDNKRVRNGRLKAILGTGLRHPTYREGLGALKATELASRQGAPGRRAR